MKTVHSPGNGQDDGVSELRRVSRQAHETVDQAFSRFSLEDRDSYGAFLLAHARALLAAEDYLGQHPDTLPAWRPRSALLRQDLEQLGLPVPASQKNDLPVTAGAALGVLYVLEGSRLGGRVLSARVGEGLPKAYLSAVHHKGEWPQFLGMLAQVMNQGDDACRRGVTEGAIAAFSLFRDSALLQAEG